MKVINTEAIKAYNKLNGMINSVCETIMYLPESPEKKVLKHRLEIQKDTLLSVKSLCFSDQVFI